jgi:hypothetical protein
MDCECSWRRNTVTFRAENIGRIWKSTENKLIQNDGIAVDVTLGGTIDERVVSHAEEFWRGPPQT